MAICWQRLAVPTVMAVPTPIHQPRARPIKIPHITLGRLFAQEDAAAFWLWCRSSLPQSLAHFPRKLDRDCRHFNEICRGIEMDTPSALPVCPPATNKPRVHSIPSWPHQSCHLPWRTWTMIAGWEGDCVSVIARAPNHKPMHKMYTASRKLDLLPG